MRAEQAIPSLGPLETQVMHVLWDHGDLTVREIIGHLPADPAYTTIATVLRHLDGKGMVAAVKDGRSTRFTVRRSREAYTAEVMDQALEASRNRTASILHFVDAIGEDDRTLLREYLRNQERLQ